MKKKSEIVTGDAKSCIKILKSMMSKSDQIYKIYEKNGNIILEPIKEIHEREKWLLDPKNKDILDRLKKALSSPATIDFDEFKKTLKIKK